MNYLVMSLFVVWRYTTYAEIHIVRCRSELQFVNATEHGVFRLQSKNFPLPIYHKSDYNCDVRIWTDASQRLFISVIEAHSYFPASVACLDTPNQKENAL